MVQLYQNQNINSKPSTVKIDGLQIDWKPSPVIALATSVDGLRVAAAREDGSLELWLVSPGSDRWHCQLTIRGDPNKRVSSLVWCNGSDFGRLFSSNLDGSVSKWDFFHLKQTTVLESDGVSIWKMAVTLPKSSVIKAETKGGRLRNGHGDSDESENSESDEDSDSPATVMQSVLGFPRVAIGYDDGRVGIYAISDTDEFMHVKSLLRVKGRVLSVTWSEDANYIYSGSSEGLIQIWDALSGHEVDWTRVGQKLCIWSLLFLRSGALVSADSSGGVQFWDSKNLSPLQAHSLHKGDAIALAAAPSHDMVFSAGSDGQVILYTLSKSSNSVNSPTMKKWIHVKSVRSHTHDVRALTVAVPIVEEDCLPDERIKRIRREEKPKDFSYHKWAHMKGPLLISAGDDTKLFAYPVKEFTTIHDICPAPQGTPIQLVLNTALNQSSMLLVQSSHWLDIHLLQLRNVRTVGRRANPKMQQFKIYASGRVQSKTSQQIICSTISNSGILVAYSDQEKPSLVELKCEVGKITLTGHDRRIYVVDVSNSELVHTFTPRRELQDEKLPLTEPPITKLFSSSDKQWQHWFISRLDGASVTAGGFPPYNNNVLIVTTSSNKVYAFDVEAKKLGEWSNRNTHVLPTTFREFPGEVIGISFPPLSTSSSFVVYSSRYVLFKYEGDILH
ncbi:hypothetical protein TSUD_355710 [Trifolium subterraneum]|uniref:Uncharacterized protein n=1 Tax=Trifolium subterraneum TaxID=3900 RepID=A0A2Z6MH55_TRISU|nr:hypothetical protein TSUD_355710 [Trifolium subterraneum]